MPHNSIELRWPRRISWWQCNDIEVTSSYTTSYNLAQSATDREHECVACQESIPDPRIGRSDGQFVVEWWWEEQSEVGVAEWSRHNQTGIGCSVQVPDPDRLTSNPIGVQGDW
jgi:hypothetical protein